jgi:hypothetical protein
LSSTLELSTLGCSSTNNNTLQVYREQHWVLRWNYLLSAVQVHTTTHFVLEQPRVDNSSVGLNAVLYKPAVCCCVYLNSRE